MGYLDSHSNIIVKKTGFVFLAETGRRFFTKKPAYYKTAAARIKKLRPCPGHVEKSGTLKRCDSRCLWGVLPDNVAPDPSIYDKTSFRFDKVKRRYARMLKFYDRNKFEIVQKVEATFFYAESGKRVFTRSVAFYLTACFRARVLGKFDFYRPAIGERSLIMSRYAKMLKHKYKKMTPEERAIREILKF